VSSHSSAARPTLDVLIVRCLPALRRWAHGRLPRWARAISDTTDLIQDALLRTLARLHTFEPRGHEALAAYLREAVRNRMRDEHRRLGRRGLSIAPDDSVCDRGTSPYEQLADAERQARYRAALARLDEPDRQLIVAHVELEYTHAQLGYMTGRSPNAARMALHRAICRLAEEMRDR
jgi:RNA polymerase sigma-70 factor (ECF subfamily)